MNKLTQSYFEWLRSLKQGDEVYNKQARWNHLGDIYTVTDVTKDSLVLESRGKREFINLKTGRGFGERDGWQSFSPAPVTQELRNKVKREQLKENIKKILNENDNFSVIQLENILKYIKNKKVKL